jgi:hypothetical protein
MKIIESGLINNIAKIIKEDGEKVKIEAYFVLSNLASSYEVDMDLKFWD